MPPRSRRADRRRAGCGRGHPLVWADVPTVCRPVVLDDNPLDANRGVFLAGRGSEGTTALILGVQVAEDADREDQHEQHRRYRAPRPRFGRRHDRSGVAHRLAALATGHAGLVLAQRSSLSCVNSFGGLLPDRGVSVRTTRRRQPRPGAHTGSPDGRATSLDSQT